MDIRGIPVVSVADRRIRDVAKAGLGPGSRPVIWYNSTVLSFFAPQTRLFWYAHECGHHALGHNFGTTHPLRVEQAADCFGIRSLRDNRLVSKRDMRVIQRDLAKLGRGDWAHLPDRQRAVNLTCCLGSAGMEHRRRPDTRRQSRLGGVCYTPARPCPLVRPLRLRSQYFCPTPYGHATGQVEN